MARLERVVHHSAYASIIDVLAYGNEAIPVDAHSVAFVRSGYFNMNGQTTSIVDANYAVVGGGEERLLSDACKHICACTIVRYQDLAVPIAPTGCSLALPRAYLLHAKLLLDARRGIGDPDADALELLRELREVPGHHGCAHSRVVTEIRRLMNEHRSTRLSLESIGRLLYVSPFTASRLFHRETGLRLSDYALRLRLRRAFSFLMHGSKNLTHIAIDLGFYDEPHFSKAFRAEFGISPQSVRKYSTKSDFC